MHVPSKVAIKVAIYTTAIVALTQSHTQRI